MQKNTFFNLGLLVGSLTLSCFFIELYVRLNPRIYSQGYVPSKNKKIVYELHPGYYIRSLNSKISTQGLHDRTFTLKKPSGVYRIAVVGDSQSFGWKVGSENSYPKLLEVMLNKIGKSRFEVINFSVPGYNTAQQAELIKTKVIKFSPDLVILAFDPNDTHICNYFQPRITLRNFLFHRSYALHAFLRLIDFRMHRPNISLYQLKRWERFKRDILGMYYYQQIIYSHPGLEEISYTQEGDSPSTFDQVPQEYWYMLGYDNYKNFLSEIYTILKQHNIKFISGGWFTNEALEINQSLGITNICNFRHAWGDRKDIFLPNDAHMNIKGHKLVADCLYKYLQDNMIF